MLHVHPVPAFHDNYIWLLHDGSGHCLITALDDLGLTPTAILVTHHHPDHIAGIAPLLARWPIPVYGPARENIPGCSHRLHDGDQIRFDAPEVTLDVLDVPGHTLGHIAYYVARAEPPVLLCGDTLFSGGCGRLFEGTAAQLQHSLDRYAGMPGHTLLCCTHEYTEANLRFALSLLPQDPAIGRRMTEVRALRAQGRPSLPSTLAEERQSNVFLRCEDPTVIKALANDAEEPVDRLSVFTALRARKDRF
jgi:hydroxyacylglutathione hydrolase